jgi:SPFH domain / Band 7 family
MAVLAGSAYRFVDWWPRKTVSTATPLQNASKTKAAENSSPALRVQFRDGAVGYVELSFSFALDPSAVIDVYRNYGDQQRAVAELRHSVEAAAYKTLEERTMDEARQSRSQIEAAIIQLTKDAQKRTGHTIEQVSLKQIERLR